MTNDKYIDINGDKISYSITYNKKKKNKVVAVMLHGFGMDKDEKGNYIRLADRLLEHDIDSIRIDLLGHGNSSGSTLDLTIDKGLEEIEAILSLYCYQEVYMVGTSYGGGLAVIYASFKIVNKIVLWSPLLDYYNNIIKPQNHFCREFLGEEALKNIKAYGYSCFGPDGVKFNNNIFKDANKYSPPLLLEKIKSDIKIFHGDRDIIIPYKQSLDMLNYNNDIDISIIEGATHCFYDDSIDNVIEETVKFLIKKDNIISTDKMM